MVSLIIYLKKEHNAKELVKFLLSEKLIVSATIDENNISYILENNTFHEDVYSVITSQSKALLFNEIVNVVELQIGEETPIISTPIVASNKIFNNNMRDKTIPTKTQNMNIQLLHGEFSSHDALELITKMIHIKIKYHENKIANNSNEEDIKYRESKIKLLQKELFDLRNNIDKQKGNLKLEAVIKIE